MLERLGLVRRAPDVRVGGVGLRRAVPVGQAAGEQPLGHLLAAAELADEAGVQPRLVDPQRRVGEQAVPVEPLDVVALEGGAVAPDLHVVIEHRPHQQRARDGPPERGGIEIGPATRTDVESPASQRGEPLLDQGGAAVDQPCGLRAVRGGAARHRREGAAVAAVGGVATADDHRVAGVDVESRRQCVVPGVVHCVAVELVRSRH